MSGELVRFSLDDHVATITINRPEVRNALNRAAYREPRRPSPKRSGTRRCAPSSSPAPTPPSAAATT